jgi:hypothetical protein
MALVTQRATGLPLEQREIRLTSEPQPKVRIVAKGCDRSLAEAHGVVGNRSLDPTQTEDRSGLLRDRCKRCRPCVGDLLSAKGVKE